MSLYLCPNEETHTSDVSPRLFFPPIPKQFYDRGPPFKLKRFMDFLASFFLLFFFSFLPTRATFLGHFPIIPRFFFGAVSRKLEL
jgi:hypothetical protein